MKKKGKTISKKVSIEELHHFSCMKCKKWWTVGDADRKKMIWYCAWCGEKHTLGKK